MVDVAGVLRIGEAIVSEEDFARAAAVLAECGGGAAECISRIEEGLHIPFILLANPCWLAGAGAGRYRLVMGLETAEVVVEKPFTRGFRRVAERILGLLRGHGFPVPRGCGAREAEVGVIAGPRDAASRADLVDEEAAAKPWHQPAETRPSHRSRGRRGRRGRRKH